MDSNQDQHFPNITNSKFTEKDRICHSLIEGTYLKNCSNDFVMNVLNFLAFYEQTSEDFIIDCLFMKYLKSYRKIAKQSDINNLIFSMIANQQIISQYHIAFICFCDIYDNFMFHDQLFAQSWKLRTEEPISINGFNLSYVISSYLLKEDELCLNNEIHNEIKINNPEYDDILTNINQYYPLSFWKSIKIPEGLKIIVNDNPFLFHAGACLSLFNPSILIVYDIKKLTFSENFNYDLIKLSQYVYTKEELLEMDLLSSNDKNLSVLIYFLIQNDISFRDLLTYRDLMNPRSFLILSMIYSNYLKKDISFFLSTMISDLIDFTNSRDIILAKFFLLMLKPNWMDLINTKMSDIFYIAPKKIFNTKMNKLFKDSNAYYGFLKKKFSYGDIRKEGKEKIFNNNQKDFYRFLSKSIMQFPVNVQEQIIYSYDIDTTSPISQAVFLLIYLKKRKFRNAKLLIKSMSMTDYFKNALKQIDTSYILDLFEYCNTDEIIEIFTKLEINELLDQRDLIDIYQNIDFDYARININRNNFLKSSIKSFLKVGINYIIVSYENEKGLDYGGLSKDWFSTASKEILNTKVFTLVPNGVALTIDENNIDLPLIYFVGQLIGSAFNSRRNVDIKLTSFIWKLLLNQQISLEDMKNYDNELYRSLFWITQNDPEPLMLTFVNSYDEELCPNGRNIEVTEDNKNEYIKLLMKSIFLRKKYKAFQYLKNGFMNSVYYNIVKNIHFDVFKDTICGDDKINCNDWKNNTMYEKKYQFYFNRFFEVISKWSQEKLKKLLKFVTGSSVVPIGGFKNFYKIGGLFSIHFYEDSSEKLPSTHTCFNTIDIPCYKSIEAFEKKLSIVIEYEEFGFL